MAAMTALAPAILLSALGVSVAAVALPALTRTFAASVGGVQWVIIVYLMATTVTVVLAGRLGDLFGHRPVLLVGIALFSLASAACALAPTLAFLVTARALQGIGGAILMALPVSLVREGVATERMGSAMGLLGTTTAIGTALGPTLGGFVIAGFGWRTAFGALAAFGLLVFVLALRFVVAAPSRKVKTRAADLGLPSAAVLGIALTAYALLAAGGPAGVPIGPVPLAVVALASLAAYLVVERRARVPLVPLAVVRQRTVGLALAMNALVSTVMMSTFVVGPFFLAFGLGLNEALVGLVMAVGPASAALSGVPAGRITDRFGERRVAVIGLCQMSVSLLALALLPRHFGIAGYAVSLMLLTPGFQMFLAANNTTVMFAAPPDRRGTLSGLLGLSRNLGLMTGASVMGAVFAAALGPVGVAQASGEAIGDAFTTTFLLATGLVVTALVLALIDRTGPTGGIDVSRRAPDDR